jgi:hypothetical protein
MQRSDESKGYDETEQSGKRRRMGREVSGGSSEHPVTIVHKIPVLTGLVHNLTISDPLDEVTDDRKPSGTS